MDFLILKVAVICSVFSSVNGLDVSSCSHEEAVRVLSQASQQASQPIMVEVKQRESTDLPAVTVKSSQEQSVQTEAELGSYCDNCCSERDQAHTYYNFSKEEENFIYPELQYEEIELKRPANNPSEMLGLTLCYEDEDEEGQTEIFLDDIHPLGLAARDGRLRLGDQIIQISGERVRRKARAQELFRTLKGDISLLVVRPPPPAQGYDDDLDNLLDLSQSLSQTKAGEDYKAGRDKNRLSSTSSKDSGHNSGSMDRTSTGSSQSSQSQSDSREDKEPPALQPPAFSRPGQSSQNKPSECLYSTDSDFYYVDGKLKEIADFYREVKNADRLGGGVCSESVVIDPVYEIIPECSDGDEMYCLPQDSRQDSRLDCSKQENNKFRNKSQEKIKSICRSISSPMKMNEFLQNKVRRSTSNYRQSEHWQGGQSWLPSNNNNNNNNNTITNQHLPPPPPPPTTTTTSSLRLSARSGGCGGSSLSLVAANQPSQPSPDMISYTNINNLERTMRDQQEALLSHLTQPPQFCAPPPPPSLPPPGSEAEQHWEWRLKVRPDGSRYIARRPTRTFLLRQRERQIAEERSGLTSDDDTASEVKVGKFWTRDQRKKHLEDSKERRRRQEDIIKSKSSVSTKVKTVNNNQRHSYHEGSSAAASNEIVLTVATV